MLDWQPKAPYTAEQLLEILRILRDPENGCPWDKGQTHASIRKNFLEETCEALEAIDADDPVLLREELGDVLMQVVFHAAMEEERGRFTFEDVCRNVCEKLVFRHPNIFASSAAENAGSRRPAAVCSGKRRPACGGGCRGSTDLCIQALCTAVSGTGTTRYSGRMTCSDRTREFKTKIRWRQII